EITYGRSSKNPALLYKLEKPRIEMGELCKLGSQMRPHVVWFGEQVPMISKAMHEMPQADMVILVGSSMAVYPAAGLLDLVKPGIPIFIVDPKIPNVNLPKNVIKIEEKASVGVPALIKKLIDSE